MKRKKNMNSPSEPTKTFIDSSFQENKFQRLEFDSEFGFMGLIVNNNPRYFRFAPQLGGFLETTCSAGGMFISIPIPRLRGRIRKGLSLFESVAAMIPILSECREDVGDRKVNVQEFRSSLGGTHSTLARKSHCALAFLALAGLLFLLTFADAAWLRTRRTQGLAWKAELVARLQLTDLCLFPEARYTRHPSQADLHSAFQDHPIGFEHFPSGSMLPPPRAQINHANLDRKTEVPD
jgi:hypothetical protein